MATKPRSPIRIAGFTLIELMIVVSIIGILAAIAIPKFADLVRKAKEGATLGKLGSLRGALNIYYSDLEGHYPAEFCGVPCTNALRSLTLNAQFIKSIPEAQPADYHASRSSEFDTGSSGLPGWLDVTGWLYDNQGVPPFTFGGVYINCTHTDSKGSIWSAY